MIERLANRYGWRGLWLIVMGATWCLFGVGVLLSPEMPQRSWVLFELIPTEVRGPVWFITGACAIWQGTRGPVADDSRGHVALYVMPAVQLVSFTVAAFVHVTTLVLVSAGVLDRLSGWSGAWYAALVWSFVSIMLALGARWPNPVPPMPAPPCQTGDRS